MAEKSIADMVKDLSDKETEDKTSDLFDITKQLEQALIIIDTPKLPSANKKLAKQLIMDAIYTAHLFCMKYYQINDALVAISRIQGSLSMMIGRMSENRPRIPLIGITANNTLLPLTFQSEAEASSYKAVIQKALGHDKQCMNLTSVELSTTEVTNVPIKPSSALHIDADSFSSSVINKPVILPNPILKIDPII